jgi:hypothetical protein
MPGLDQTGPAGYVPGMGKGMGPCGRGMANRCGFGQGSGNGICRHHYAGSGPLSMEAKKQQLEAELKRLEAEKAEIQRRLTFLE